MAFFNAPVTYETTGFLTAGKKISLIAVSADGVGLNEITPAQFNAIKSGSASATSSFTGATYETSGLFRCLGYVAGGVTYSIAYSTGLIVVTGSDGSTKTITVDGSNRPVSVV